MKLTPWFSGDERPKRHGVYEREIVGTVSGGPCVYFAHYGPIGWAFAAFTIADAVHNGSTGSYTRSGSQTDFRWRGLTTKDGR